MEVKGCHFVGCSVTIEREAIGPAQDDPLHGLTEQLLVDGQPRINAQSEAVKWCSKLPVLRTGYLCLHKPGWFWDWRVRPEYGTSSSATS